MTPVQPTAPEPPSHVRTDTRVPPAGPVATWSLVAAWILAVLGVADLVRWGNRWYLAEVFARLASADGGGWAFAYQLLHKAHEALVRGVVLLLVAALVFALVRRSRRGSRDTAAT